MKRTKWKQYAANIAENLAKMIVSDGKGDEIPADEAFASLRKLISRIRKKRKALYFAGNGASASIASHFAADFAKNGRMHTQVFTDQSLITAVSNDISYEDVFSFPLSLRGCKEDALVAISSSGNSPNILKAADTAKKLGMLVVTMSSMREDNSLRKKGDFNFFIPAGNYGHAESMHTAILHHLMDMIEIKRAANIH